MNRKLIIICAATVFVMVAALVVRPDKQWGNESLHSTMEAVEGLSVLLMSVFLLGRKEEASNDKLVLPAMGFLGMGIINIAHAASGSGNAFVFLRSAASFFGGLGFALVWLRAPYRAALYRPAALRAVPVGAVMVCLAAFLCPALLPPMVRQGAFTTVAVSMNMLAGVFFLLGAWRFLIDLTRSDEREDLLFCLVGIFFGLSGLMFNYSMLWTETWWFWHVLRILGSLLVLGLLIRRHLGAVTGLKNSLLELKKAEDEVRRSYQVARSIIDSMNDAIALIDVKNLRIITVNTVFLKEYGYSDESEVAGKHCYEVTHHRSLPCAPPDDICPISETVKTGGHSTVEHAHCSRDGNKIYVEVTTSPIKDAGGNVVQVVHISSDITERRQAQEEREKLLSDLERSNKDLEQFAYAASHDLQEPLRTMTGYVQLLEMKFKGRLDEKADRYIHFMVDGAERMRNLIDALLVYSRTTRRSAGLRAVDFNTVFFQAVSNLSASVSEGKAIITKDDLPEVLGDETQLIQLLQNLIGNGLKYRKTGVSPRIHVSSRKEADEFVFSVRDNGIGIESRYFERIFEVFQRLHGYGEYTGAGIGLAICKRIVERHHGRIWVESAPGQGSAFFFTLRGSHQEQKQ